MTTAWIFEDLNSVSEPLAKALYYIRFKTEIRSCFRTAIEAISAVSSNDVVCLDSQLPSEGTARTTAGLELCARLRAAGIGCGIIWHSLTAMPDEVQQMGGVNATTIDEIAGAAERLRHQARMNLLGNTEQWRQIAAVVLSRLAAVHGEDAATGSRTTEHCRWLRLWMHDFFPLVLRKCDAARNHLTNKNLASEQQHLLAQRSLSELRDDYSIWIEQCSPEFKSPTALLSDIRATFDANTDGSRGVAIVQKVAELSTKCRHFNDSYAALEQAALAGDHGRLHNTLGDVVNMAIACSSGFSVLEKDLRAMSK
jgi:CheY-like chemotaxis protein